ncbi:single-stranded-DNA-specific exonuclease RecJ, partial [Acidithiobacillus sp.]|uniref:single-stranded-DNA-specific exonuclease RecJ n=1 Tax=Acidithiobacillus sp. TaxID=1872118 RepID=UPI003D044C2A
RVGYLLPNRFTEGYGLSPVLADKAAGQGAQLLITVDNGVAAVAGVQRAQELGLEVIVTDHHLPGPLLPPTPYLVNPNLPDSAFASKALCGVGVAFYLVSALWRTRILRGRADPQDVLPKRLLDLVALGTVADVVPLDPNNRRLVAAGLRQIRSGESCPGIQALLEVAGIDAHRVTERDLGFSLGPRINAAGRLEDMHIGVELLLATDIDDALPYAQHLDILNQERREIEQDRLQEALSRLDRLDCPESSPALVFFDPDGHEGVVGLVAGRLRER